MSTIVVGIDDSAEARRALSWAAREARLRQASLVVVHAWTFSQRATGLAIEPVLDSVRRVAHDLVENALDELGDEAAGLEIKPVVVEGAPAPALLEAARDADLLVVGSRGRGGFTGLLLGSVSQQCAQHAPCPLVIVPTARHD